MRIRFSAIPDYLKWRDHKDYWELELKNGSTTVGKKESENEASVKLQMGNGRITFQKSEIIRMSPIEPATIRSGNYEDWIIDNPKKPAVTQRFEDSLLFQIQKLADVAGPHTGIGERPPYGAWKGL